NLRYDYNPGAATCHARRSPLRVHKTTYTNRARIAGHRMAEAPRRNMNGNGGNRMGDGTATRDVLLDQQYVWPGDLTQIPDWVYTDEAIYRREIERIFHGPTWNYVALEAEIPHPGDFIRSNVGPTTVVVARTRDGSISVVENRCAHRAAEFCRELTG